MIDQVSIIHTLLKELNLNKKQKISIAKALLVFLFNSGNKEYKEFAKQVILGYMRAKTENEQWRNTRQSD